jgi:hypothetical protein
MIYAVVTLIAIIASVNAKIYFKEDFNNASWEKRWVVPTEWKPKVRGETGPLVASGDILTMYVVI